MTTEYTIKTYPKFDKELKKLTKKYPSLEKDFERLKKSFTPGFEKGKSQTDSG